MRIFKGKIRYWSLPLITIINYRIIIIDSYYNYIIMHFKIIVFLIKASSRYAIRQKVCK
jgi:hypothetical protein